MGAALTYARRCGLFLQLQREIEDRYSRGKFLQEPKVTIAAVEYRPVYLFGEVARPAQSRIVLASISLQR